MRDKKMSSNMVAGMIADLSKMQTNNSAVVAPRPDATVRTASEPALTSRVLDVHFYDGRIDPKAVEAVNRGLQSVASSFDVAYQQVTDAIAQDGVDEPASLHHMQPALDAFRLLSPEDPSNGVNVQDAFRIAWHLVRAKGDRDLRQIFFLNLDDMIRTHGTCQQGRSSRMLQIVAALMNDE